MKPLDTSNSDNDGQNAGNGGSNQRRKSSLPYIVIGVVVVGLILLYLHQTGAF